MVLTAERPSVVEILGTCGEPLGTGLAVTPRAVCTCQHVIEQSWPVYVDDDRTVRTGPRDRARLRTATVIRDDVQGTDVALVEPDRQLDSSCTPLVRGVTEDFLSLWSGRLWAMGFSGGRAISYRDLGIDTVSGVDRRTQLVFHARLSAGLLPGFSGAPVLYWSKTHYVCIGMVQTGGNGSTQATFVGSDPLIDEISSRGVQPRTIDAGEIVGDGTGAPDEPPRTLRRIVKDVRRGLRHLAVRHGPLGFASLIGHVAPRAMENAVFPRAADTETE